MRKIREKLFDMNIRVTLLKPEQSKWRKWWLKKSAAIHGRTVINATDTPERIIEQLVNRFYNTSNCGGYFYWAPFSLLPCLFQYRKTIKPRNGNYNYGIKSLRRNDSGGVDSCLILAKITDTHIRLTAWFSTSKKPND